MSLSSGGSCIYLLIILEVLERIPCRHLLIKFGQDEKFMRSDIDIVFLMVQILCSW